MIDTFIYAFVCIVCKLYFKIFHFSRIDGWENIPDGPCILVANHVSFFDPPFIGAEAVVQTAGPIYILARKTLFKPPVLHWLLPVLHTIPVDQERPDMVGLKKIIQHAKNGHKVLLFPEGSRSFDGKLQRSQAGIGLLVAKAKVPVVPIRGFGLFEAWPRDGKIKLFTPVRAVIGKPFSFPENIPTTKESYQAIGDQIMDAIAQLH